jgi:hypothetical protein
MTPESEKLLMFLCRDPETCVPTHGADCLLYRGEMRERLEAIEAAARARQPGFLFDSGDTGECGWVCPFGKGAHPATSTHYFVPRGVCGCGHRGADHPGDGACGSKVGCGCDGMEAKSNGNRVWALEEALREVLRLGHIQDDGPSLCKCRTHTAARAVLEASA